MADKIYYGSYVFGEDRYKITGGNITRAVSAVGEELSADEIRFTIKMNPPRDEQLFSLTDDLWSLTDALYSTDTDHSAEFMNYNYGTPIYYEHNGHRTKYYVKSVARLGKREYEFNCISAVGLLINKKHYGGMYAGGVPFRNVVADMLDATLARETDDTYYYNGIVPYSVSKEVGNSMLYEYLPIGTAQSNLNIALLAVGADIFRDEDLNMSIRFNKVNDPVEIPNIQNYYGGKVHYIAPATQINVTEHNYVPLDTDNEVVLFDNTASSGTIADNEIVTFQNPCHNLKWNGADLPAGWEYGVNYAIVSGNGVLTGQEYTHITKVYELLTDVSGEPNVVNVDPYYTLIGTANVAAVARRIAAYCSTAIEMQIGFVDEGINPGDYIRFKSPYGEMANGIIKSMNETISGILKSDTTIECGWVPGDFGNDYDDYVEISADGSWTVPSGTKSIMVVLIGGGHGGDGGHSGEPRSGLNKSKGGEGGALGDGGRILTQVIDVQGGESISFTIGLGGEGGESDQPGEEGGATTATISGETYSSADGAASPYGFTNFMTGEIVALPGVPGVAGGDGNPSGKEVVFEGITYYPGRQGSTVTYQGVTANGGYGGGAAVGSNGYSGRSGGVGYSGGSGGSYYAQDGEGGFGATPTISPPDATGKANGGSGGHGGGGVGQSQNYRHWESNPYPSPGHGSKGSKGAKGLGYVFY